jgi:hypothetical protein
LKDSRFLFFFLVVLLCGALGLTGTASWALRARSGDAPEPVRHAGAAAGAASGARQDVYIEDQESGNNLYRHSASVKFLGRWLHLGK